MNKTLEDRITAQERTDPFKSEGERRIAQFLDRYAIRYAYEQGVLVTDRGKPKIWHPDFYLPEFAAYIEYYGLAGNPDYDRGILKKTSVYGQMGLDVIPLYPKAFDGDWQGHIMTELHDLSQRRIETLHQKPYRYSLPLRSYNGARPPRAGYAAPAYSGRYWR